ncbi:hypothetical protein EVAR_5016_1 [Eumeta japonica]|uniref:Uncharacterized protein n=1 Tax=Eumeta variegata TaxID=151549 RepID=A0A4C1SWX9_EUMVA|nr:hypothetical protein EVAR_5016_1 [Eumeta japonica]
MSIAGGLWLLVRMLSSLFDHCMTAVHLTRLCRYYIPSPQESGSLLAGFILIRHSRKKGHATEREAVLLRTSVIYALSYLGICVIRIWVALPKSGISDERKEDNIL